MKNKKESLISVIFPIYNVEKYLEKSLNSIINQTYTNLEIILIDDGSPDNCPKICDDYANKDSRIKVIHKKNGGISDARNVGVKNSTGEYVCFVDPDDYVELNYVEELYKSLISNNADMSICGHKVFYDTGRVIDRFTNEKYCADSELIFDKLLYDDGIDLTPCGKLYKKSLFKNINYPVGRLYEDAATTYKLIDKAKKISVNSIPLYNYSIRTNSITTCSFNKKKLDLIISTKEMTDFIRKKYPNLKSGCDRRLMYAYLSTLTQLAMSKKQDVEIQKELTNYILKNKNSILRNRRVPKRDKIGIYSLLFGYNFYHFMWNCYLKISGRK